MIAFLTRAVDILMGKNKAPQAYEVPLTCLEYKQGNHFIARCLELNIATRGENSDEARCNLVDLITQQIHYALEKSIPIYHLFHPAPFRSLPVRDITCMWEESVRCSFSDEQEPRKSCDTDELLYLS